MNTIRSWGFAIPFDIRNIIYATIISMKPTFTNFNHFKRKSPMFPFNFPKAIILPAKEILPIINPRRISSTSPENISIVPAL